MPLSDRRRLVATPKLGEPSNVLLSLNLGSTCPIFSRGRGILGSSFAAMTASRRSSGVNVLGPVLSGYSTPACKIGTFATVTSVGADAAMTSGFLLNLLKKDALVAGEPEEGAPDGSPAAAATCVVAGTGLADSGYSPLGTCVCPGASSCGCLGTPGPTMMLGRGVLR